MLQSNETTNTVNIEEPLVPNTFTNHVIQQLPMPSISQLSQTMVSNSYAKANRYVRLLITLFIVLVLSIIWHVAPLQNFITVSPNVRFYIACFIVATAIWGGWLTLYGAFADKRKFYALREHDISYTSGIVFTRTVSQPVQRIQHVELKRGPIDRKIGLAKLQVFSAGGALHTFEIPGLPIDDAQKIRQFILDQKDTNRNG